MSGKLHVARVIGRLENRHVGSGQGYSSRRRGAGLDTMARTVIHRFEHEWIAAPGLRFGVAATVVGNRGDRDRIAWQGAGEPGAHMEHERSRKQECRENKLRVPAVGCRRRHY